MISNESQTFGFFNELSQFLFRNWLTKIPHGLYIDYNVASTNGPLWTSSLDRLVQNRVPIESKNIVKQYLLKLRYKNSSIAMLIKNTKCTYQILLTAHPVKTLRGSTYRYQSDWFYENLCAL